ncbi:MAG: T9SS type A sorting domain-containing protein [Bacteroidota bacterium]
MKKLLLLLFLFLSLNIYSQPPSTMPPLEICDMNNDGFSEFDLTSQVPTILNGLNPATTVITFHETITGAQTGTDVLVNPVNYFNINPFVQTIYIRVADTTNSQVYFSSIDLTALPAPIGNPATMTFCDTTELAIYDLTSATNQIIPGLGGATVTYYQTLTDAQAGVNPLGPTYIPLINPGSQVLFARVQDTTTGCFSITTLTLNTHNCGEACPTPTDLAATAVTDTTFTLNWTNPPGWMGILYFNVLLLPQGSPAPTQNATGFIATATASFVIPGLSPNTCYSVYVRSLCNAISTGSNWSEPLNICLPNCAESGACSELLVLNAFLDSNNNGVKDTGEIDFNQGNFVYQVNDSGYNLFGNSNDGSYYIFDANPSNSYDISFAVNADFSTYYTSAVSHNNITLPSGSGANYLYFPIANPVPHVDAQVNLDPIGQPRPGFIYSSIIHYRNNGSQTIPNGTLTFTKHPSISIASVSQTGTTATATGFTYDFTNLAPFEVRHIQVNLAVPTIPTVNLGDLITNNVTVQIGNDINLANNSSSITQTVVGSYDPNDKMESHGGKIVHSTFTSNDYLYYTIQFENTGSANAEFIRVEDALNSQLDENTFEMLSASHNVDTKRLGNQLTWHFYNIDLPPTSSNPSGSHGYVSFKIKPKTGYAIGDIIPNTASIYFDYNPAIVTNQFDTEFVMELDNPSFSSNEFNLYPNPANGNVYISQNGNEMIENIQFYDVTGKTIKSISNVNAVQTNIDITALAKGIYFVEITAENNIKQTKKLITQ